MRLHSLVGPALVTLACSRAPSRDVEPIPQPRDAAAALALRDAVQVDAAMDAITMPMDARTAGVEARFETPPRAMTAREAKLAFVVENRGTSPVTLDRDELSHALFAIEVFDATGKRRYTVPPGLPPPDYKPRMEALAPGKSWRIELDLWVFSPPLEPGQYTAKLSSSSIQSTPVTFTIE